MSMSIKENISNIYDAIPKDVMLVTVTKTRTIEEIKEAIQAGVSDIGENKVQEILDKYDAIGKDVRWHMIGHLQTNKVKKIIGKVDLIHSLDSFKLAKEIDRCAKLQNLTQDVLVQVNTGNDPDKFGLAENETVDFIKKVLVECTNLKIKGLMCVAPNSTEEIVRKCFRNTKTLFDECKRIEAPNSSFEYLSMGMSGDYDIAVQEGSNVIRIGSKIFGKRTY